MCEPKFRIEGKRNATMAGTPVTLFRVRERMGARWIDRGETYALGHDADDRACIAYALVGAPLKEQHA
jgi:hypothetical protein